MLDGNASIHRCHRLYYAYLGRSGSSWGGGVSGAGARVTNAAALDPVSGSGASMEHTFGRPMVLMKLGQYIMDVKVRKCLMFRDLLFCNAS